MSVQPLACGQDGEGDGKTLGKGLSFGGSHLCGLFCRPSGWVRFERVCRDHLKPDLVYVGNPPPSRNRWLLQPKRGSKLFLGAEELDSVVFGHASNYERANILRQ